MNTPMTTKRTHLLAILSRVSASVNARWQSSGGRHPCVAHLILRDNYRVLRDKRSTRRDILNRLSETVPYLALWLDCTKQPLPRVRALAHNAAQLLKEAA